MHLNSVTVLSEIIHLNCKPRILSLGSIRSIRLLSDTVLTSWNKYFISSGESAAHEQDTKKMSSFFSLNIPCLHSVTFFPIFQYVSINYTADVGQEPENTGKWAGGNLIMSPMLHWNLPSQTSLCLTNILQWWECYLAWIIHSFSVLFNVLESVIWLYKTRSNW